MPSDTVDMILTSPPYDNLRNYNKQNTFNFETFKQLAVELYRVLKYRAVVVWIVNDATIKGSETGTSFKQALYFKEIGFNLFDTMIYEKNGVSIPDMNRYYQTFEYMFVFVKPTNDSNSITLKTSNAPKTFNPLSDRKNKHLSSWGRQSHRDRNGNLLQSKERTACGEYGKRFNVWKYNTGMKCTASDNIAYLHPALMPEKLAEDHILSWSNENDIVFDPFMGSGTTAKMCLKHNRNYIGCDISEEYCNIARERIKIFQIKLEDERKKAEEEKRKQEEKRI
jgi:site-specific DNA-methyltransferase (adenine-specific)